jgi:hypothetical protein
MHQSNIRTPNMTPRYRCSRIVKLSIGRRIFLEVIGERLFLNDMIYRIIKENGKQCLAQSLAAMTAKKNNPLPPNRPMALKFIQAAL